MFRFHTEEKVVFVQVWLMVLSIIFGSVHLPVYLNSISLCIYTEVLSAPVAGPLGYSTPRDVKSTVDVGASNFLVRISTRSFVLLLLLL